MAAPLLQAEIEINAPVSKVWNLISDLSKMPQVEPAVPADEVAGPASAGHPHAQSEPAQHLFWPTTSTITEVIPERKLAFRVNDQQHRVELRAGADRHRHPGGRDPARRERRQGGLDDDGQRGAGRGAELREGTRRRDEHLAGPHQGGRRRARSPRRGSSVVRRTLSTESRRPRPPSSRSTSRRLPSHRGLDHVEHPVVVRVEHR